MDSGAGLPVAVARNATCPCGSGKRFKHCCGAEGAAPAQTRLAALAAHRAGQLGRAETLYRHALDQSPKDVDALHMLGVVQLERLRYREALGLLWDAAEATAWAVAAIRHNLGLVLAKLLAREANLRQAELLGRLDALERARGARKSDVSPLVTVVLPAYNHARFVREAIASVVAQTYPHIELVVIDDGSIDGTADAVRAALQGIAIPARFITRENRGAAATLNEGAMLARGAYVSFLNSDDWYAPDRIACMVDDIARSGARWGFSLVSSVTSEAGGARDAAGGECSIQRKQRSHLGTQPASFTLIEYNVAISSGNLFVEREFFASVGGFHDYRYNHDWEFCLRAGALEEPVVVGRQLYFYRVHGQNTISESPARALDEANRLLADFLAGALAGRPEGGSELAPQAAGNRDLLLRVAFRTGLGALVPIDALRAIAAEWRAKAPPGAPSGDVARSAAATGRTAVVVLGMHRSGTSALSRVLNLCGAFLPESLRPPKLGVNPKGYWEPESILDLDERLMHQLGGDWDRIDFTLPDDGEIVTEFENDACALLASEYGDEPTILIKDPRIGAFPGLWHRVLLRCGYRPVYVVPVRHPLEVAQSLHARGDMSVGDALGLWLAYSQRIAEHAQSQPDVVHLRYTDLLDDWRSVICRTAERLDLALDPFTRADEVDGFLERSLRRQVADDEALRTWPGAGAVAERALALHRENLARCICIDRPAGLPVAGSTAADRARSGAANETQASATFVLCIENNGMRDQALLLCRSIRRFAGRHHDAPILAYAPRPGLGVDRSTRAALDALGAVYVDEPLNARYPEYGPANRVFAAAHAEVHASTEFLVVLDSDSVLLGEPELPIGADVAVRPVDMKGNATRGPGDPFEPYWTGLAAACGMPLERLPFVFTTIGNERIRASYNAGFAIVRRPLGILTRCAEFFVAGARAGMKPFRGAGRDLVGSIGNVGEAASECWGSDQTALALAIWNATDRVRHLPDHYNVPLHLVAAEGEIDPRWRARPPVHVHYHWMFAQRHRDLALELLAKLGVPEDQRAWLAVRTPLHGDELNDSRPEAAAA